MTIPFTCPHCGTQTNVDEQYAGSSGPCFQCGQTVTVPGVPGKPAPSTTTQDPYGTVAPPPRKSSKLVWILVIGMGMLGLCCIMGVPIALILPAVQSAREAARRSMCSNNLKEIGVALQSYHDTYGSFPPPYFTDASGTPIHSWRVLILPQLGYTDVYNRYNFDEPWNGPNNSQLEIEMPPVYRCPSADPAVSTFDTSYVAVVGPGLLFDPTKSVTAAEVTSGDGTASTIAVVESSGQAGARVAWMSPDDPTLTALNLTINGTPGPAISSDHPHGANVLFVDGHVEFLNEIIDPVVLKDYFTVEGREAHQPVDVDTDDDPFSE